MTQAQQSLAHKQKGLLAGGPKTGSRCGQSSGKSQAYLALGPETNSSGR